MTEISSHIEKARSQIKTERDSLVQQVKDEISNQKRKALSKV
jgi:F0F1-type ATP synthase membrane subunit b/b'